MEKVTACLITWKRQYNIPKIIESLQRWPFISEIIIRDNSKGENIINYGRYTSAVKAENDIIFTQDDDCIINNLDEVYEKFIADPNRISHSGISDYLKVIPENIYGESQMALAGWGSFFKKSWIPILDEYIKKYGKDYCFFRETDRIFSILLRRHHNFILGDINHLGGERDEFALSSQGDHVRYKHIAIERALELIKEAPDLVASIQYDTV